MGKKIEDYKYDYEQARIRGDADGMQAANDGANAIRIENGEAPEYANVDIAKFRKNPPASAVPTVRRTPGYNEGKPEAYTSAYNSTIDKLLQDIMNPADFQYDYKSDPLYQQYQEGYTRNGERAMQDTLGQVSSRTGGLASSYAETASQQTYNNYMTALGDKIPELEAAAYGKYREGLNDKTRNLGILQGLESTEYGRYRDSMGDWQDGRNFAYGVNRDQIGDARYEREWNYGIGRDQVGDKRYEDERAYQEKENQYSKDRETALALANVGSFGALGELWGLDESETQALISEYARGKSLTDGQAARDLADWYAQYGDFGKLKEQGVDTTFLQQQAQGQRQAAYSGGGGNIVTTGQYNPSKESLKGVDGGVFAGIERQIKNLLNTGSRDEALSFLSANENNLSTKQLSDLLYLMGAI